MMAAIAASQQHKKVLLLEASERVGKKLLATGNGRCNFTNQNMGIEHYYTDSPQMLNQILQEYPCEKICSLFEQMGMYSKKITEYYYPYSENASTVLDTLRICLQEYGCTIKTECDVTQIQKKEHAFYVSGNSFSYNGKTVIVAAGSKAGGFYKGNQSMYHLLSGFGHHCTDLHPALTKCNCKEDYFKALAGVRAKGNLTLYINQKPVKEESGEVQFTKTGISGIPVFQISGDIAQALSAGKSVSVSINLLPEFDKSKLTAMIEQRLKDRKRCTVEQFFTGFLNKKLMSLFIKKANLKEQEAAISYSVKNLVAVLTNAMKFSTTITSVEALESAQVCRGGIPLSECTGQLMSKLQPGLFLCGELLNVDGICGGYNLHFAWASGRICGLSAADYIDHL